MHALRETSMLHSFLALGMVALAACSKSSPSPTGFAFDTAPAGTSTAPRGDSDAPPGDSGSVGDSGTPTDASPRDSDFPPDFGPIPDDGPIDGTKIDPPPTLGPLSFCPSSSDKLSAVGLVPSSAVPAAFANAWKAEVAKHPGGVLLLQLDNLKSDPQKVSLTIGASNGASPPSFSTEAFTTATAPASVDSVSRAMDAEVEASTFEVQFDATTSVPIGSFKLRGTLDGKCESVTGVTLALKISTKNGSRAFGGSTLSALLGPANDIIRSDDAWRIELVGTATFVGR